MSAEVATVRQPQVIGCWFVLATYLVVAWSGIAVAVSMIWKAIAK